MPFFPPIRRLSTSARSQKLAKQRARGSSNSCPDLSTLHITSQQPFLGGNSSYGVQIETGASAQPFPHSPTSDIVSVGDGPRKLVSTKKRVSNKARGVLGKVRTFRRIAAAKMAHPTIKIDTNVATKRGHPEDDDDGLDVLDEEDLDNPELEEGYDEDIPPFLCQSVFG